MFKQYYHLTKPGIIQGNVMTAAAGFLLASPHSVAWQRLVATLVGMSLVIGSACVFNNYLDRDIDHHMTRTKKRALVTKAISTRAALIYGAILGVLGFGVLAGLVSRLVVIIGLVGFVDYVVLYGWAKRRTVHGTLIGSVSGSMPIVAGYCAASGRFDAGAWLVFLILTTWQMPHFYAIALRRFSDYKAAGLPVLPVVRGKRAAKIQSLLYIVTFAIAVSLLTVFNYTGLVYLVSVVSLSAWWLYRGLRAFDTTDAARWGKEVFLSSLIVLLATSVLMAIGPRLP